ncbi:hypothetical protein VTP01DRAFT_4827 [Rhizomucor pusillus]|uniref:uncharacterized protein n=1 Tax=Rhizomucor pusillus TaxID=4840 RepID=UPI0037430CBD
MYWLNGVASQISLKAALTNWQQRNAEMLVENSSLVDLDGSADIVCTEASPHASLFVTCTTSTVCLWSVKPTTVLSFVERSQKHINEFGENKSVIWKPDATSIVVLTSKNYLLLYAILNFDQPSFEFNLPHSHHALMTGPGEGDGPKTMVLKFRIAIRVDAGVACGTTSDDTLIIATEKPIAIQCIAWNPHEVHATQTAILSSLNILDDPSEKVTSSLYDRAMGILLWITDAGKVYFVQNTGQSSKRERRRSSSANTVSSSNGLSKSYIPTMPSYKEPISWLGFCFHDQDKAICVAVNAKFSLLAVGTQSGKVYIYAAQNYTVTPKLSHVLSPPSTPHSNPLPEIDAVSSLSWTSDGYAVAVGYRGRGLSVWSVYGSLLTSISETDDIFYGLNGAPDIETQLTNDDYVHGIDTMFWGPGNHHLFVSSAAISKSSADDRMCLYTLPFAKSSLTSFHNGDNARRGLFQMDDRILLYNYAGDYQENNTTTIDPDAVMWTQVLYPSMYITDHWPIRYTSISADGKFIAVAGRRGFAHYNTFSNRWKMFGNQQQEQSFLVRGGLVWYKNILIVACEVLNGSPGRVYELRMFSRDNNLDNAYILYTETLQHTPLYLSICGSYLLVYTTENVLNIYNIVTRSENPNAAVAAAMNGNGTANVARIERVRRIALGNVIARVTRVRGISLFSNHAGDQITTPHDLINANIVLLVDGKLIFLSPRIPDDDDDSDLTGQPYTQPQYELNVLSDKIEYYWIGRKNVANLCTSLWAVNGHGIKVFANLLRSEEFGFNATSNDILESEPTTPTTPSLLAARATLGRPYSLGYRIGPEPASPSMSVVEMEGYSRWRIPSLKQLDEGTIYIPLDFYPHSVLLEKGVIVGVEQGSVFRESLGFLIYKMSSKTHLFLHHILQHLLRRGYEEDAVVFGRAYERLIYFGHALEILLHTVLEEETDNRQREDAILALVIKFLDQFPHALDVIVSCARKTEVALWGHLFSVVGEPKDLFELCLSDGRLRTATSYLIILQTMQPLAVGGKDTIRLLQKAMDVDDYDLCKELVRFLSSIDNSGKTLQEALRVIKTRLGHGPTSPNAEDAQVEKVVQSMQGLGSK